MEIIRRDRWGARYRNGFDDAPVPWQENWAHHSVTLAPDIEWIDANGDGVEDDEAAAMRTLDQIGQDRFGGGISYPAGIPPSGRIYEGHGVDRQGAHTGGRNDRSRAIVFIGNYEVNRLTRAQIVSAAWLLAHWYLQGWCTRIGFNGGHLQAPGQISTLCPGRHVLEAIPEINGLAAAHVRGEINLDDLKEDDLSGEGQNIIAWLATGGELTRASGPKGLAGGVDPTSIFGRIYDIQWALTKTLPVILAAARSGATIDPEALRGVISAAVDQAVDEAVAERVVPAVQDALGEDADVTAIAAATADAVKSKLGTALLEGATK